MPSDNEDETLEDGAGAGATPKTTLTDAEKQSRDLITIQEQAIKDLWGRDVTSGTNAALTAALAKHRKLIDDLETLTTKKIFNYKKDSTKQAYTQEWLSYYTTRDSWHYEYKDMLDKRLTPAPASSTPAAPPTVTPQVQAAVLKASLESRALIAKNGLNQLVSQLQKLDTGATLSRVQYSHYNKSMLEHKTTITQELPTLANSVVAADPIGAPAFMTDWSKTLANLHTLLGQVSHLVSQCDIPDSSLISPTSVAPSVPSIANLNSSTSTSDSTDSTSRYKRSFYTIDNKQRIPKFKGEYHLYPGFRREWKEAVIPDCDNPSWAIRVLNDSTPKSIDLSHLTSLDDAWEALDKKFANPMVVSDTVMREYFAVTEAKGANDDEKVIFINDLLVKMMANLNAINQTAMLTSNSFAITHAMKMLPDRAASEFSTLRRSHEREQRLQGIDTISSDQQINSLWKLFKDFLSTWKDDVQLYRPWALVTKDPPGTGGGGKTEAEKEAEEAAKKEAAKAKKKELADKKRQDRLNLNNTTSNKLSSDPAIKKKQQEFGKCKKCSGYHVWLNRAKKPNARQTG